MRPFGPVQAARALAVVVLVACSAVISHPAGAVQVHGLYEAEVGVSNQSQPERRAALRDALAQVLVKVTGDRDVAQREKLAPLLERAPHFAQQYRYLPGEERGEDASPLILWVRYDGSGIVEWLRQHGVTVWPAERPDVLVWLAVRRDGERVLVGADASSEVRSALREPARQRGLPLVIPLMDLTDQARLGFSDVWGGFLEPVRAASERYDPNAILVGRLDQHGRRWQGRWTLLHEGEASAWDARAAGLQPAIGEGIHHTVDVLASRLAVRGGAMAAAPVDIEVEGIGGFSDYARVAAYLRSLSSVRSVQVVRVWPERAAFRVTVRGGEKALDQAIGLGDTLAAAAQPEPDMSNRLHYRLEP